jgi:hypothetical protein
MRTPQRIGQIGTTPDIAGPRRGNQQTYPDETFGPNFDTQQPIRAVEYSCHEIALHQCQQTPDHSGAVETIVVPAESRGYDLYVCSTTFSIPEHSNFSAQVVSSIIVYNLGYIKNSTEELRPLHYSLRYLQLSCQVYN